MPRLFLACLFLFASGVHSVAEENIDCRNAMTQMEMTFCAGEDWKKADVKLNAAYKQAMAKIRETDSYLPDHMKGAADTLKAAQRAWIPYRDKACEAYGFLARGGTLEPQLVLSCKADLTIERTKELELLVEGM